MDSKQSIVRSEQPTCSMCREFCPSNQYVGFGICSAALDCADREDAIVQASSKSCEEFVSGSLPELYTLDCFESKTNRAFKKEVAKYLKKLCM